MEKQGEIKEYAKIRVGRYREILIAAGITALIARLFYQSVKALLLFFPVCYFYRRYSAKKEQEKRKRQLLQEFRDCMEMIEGNLLAGYALENAFLVAGKEMKELHGEGGLMQTELEIINRKVCMNQPLEVVFEEFAKKSGIEEIENFSEVLSFAKRGGGNLVGIIQNTVRNISSKIRIEEIRAKSNECYASVFTVLSGYHLSGLPGCTISQYIRSYLYDNLSAGLSGIYPALRKDGKD